MNFNHASPNIMWIDLNSAFATTEQQAHPHLRHHPVGITNRISPECCIITSSYEARACGVKTGMRRSEALQLCPELVLLESDPPKYRTVYAKLLNIMQSYSDQTEMHSIDEGLIDLNYTPYANDLDKLVELGYTIKQRVRREIGDYITINVGLGPNGFLAKLAAGLHKPDGLDVITADNLVETYAQLELTKLTGIADRYAKRLRLSDIKTPLEFLLTDEAKLVEIFHGVVGSQWYRRLRGYEVDNRPTNITTIGRQWMVDHPTNDPEFINSCLHHLAEAVDIKLRYKHCSARGVGIYLVYQIGGVYKRKILADQPIRTDADIWRLLKSIADGRNQALNLRMLNVYLYNIIPTEQEQLILADQPLRPHQLTRTIDHINARYGTKTIHSAESTVGAARIQQKVPFGSTRYFDLL